MLLDTNVLAARFHGGDAHHEDTTVFLDEWDFQWLVPSFVVVEAWGLVVGSWKNRDGGRALLSWLNTPGKAVILPRHDEPLLGVEELIGRIHRLDCVDAMLAELADDITTKCALTPNLRIATFDAVDYYSIKAQRNLKLTVYDVRSLEDEADEV
jgi:predicted nucleic acid-binding protein